MVTIGPYHSRNEVLNFEFDTLRFVYQFPRTQILPNEMKHTIKPIPSNSMFMLRVAVSARGSRAACK